MTDLTMSGRIARLEAMHREGRIIRRKWVGADVDGRELACVLAAIAPECGASADAADCPATVMPAWFARMVPSIDDRGTDAAWPAMIDRFVAIVRRAGVLRADDWRALDYAVRAIAVREAMTHTSDAHVIAVCDRVLSLCDRAARGETVAAAEWAAAERAVRAAEWALAAGAAAEEAALAAVRAAAVWAAEAGARECAWDRMTGAIFDALETRIAMREMEAWQ